VHGALCTVQCVLCTVSSALCTAGCCHKISAADIKQMRKENIVPREDEVNISEGGQTAGCARPGGKYKLSNRLLKGEGFWRQGKDRTLESNAGDATDYENEAGGNRSKLMNYNNVENQPLFKSHPSATSPTKILLKAPPPPLHVVRLGPTNHILAVLLKLWPGLQVIIANYHTLLIITDLSFIQRTP
jgi:hypothetical protein